MFRVLFLISLTYVSTSWSAIDNVLREARALNRRGEVLENEVVRVQGVRVVIADYDLIARDFPAQSRNQDENDSDWKSRVDAWLVEETGYIQKEQAQQTVVNSFVEVGTETKKVYRPQGYNRAHVLPVSGGLMDAKGVGSTNPRQAHHGNGLATLGEVIREYIYEKLVESVLLHAGGNVNTVGSYAVIDYGFDLIHADKNRDRAGYILRQAHVRASGFNSTLSRENAFLVEKTLRVYGLTSSGETYGSGEFNFDYTNIQGTDGTKSIEIIDFGAYIAVEQFQRHLVSHTDIKYILLSPEDSNFIQPSSTLRVPLDQWGDFGHHDPKADKPWVWAHDLARAWAEGRAGRADTETHLNNMLDPARRRFLSQISCETLF